MSTSRILIALGVFVSGLACAPGTALRPGAASAVRGPTPLASDIEAANGGVALPVAPLSEPIVVSMDRADLPELFASATEFAADDAARESNVLDLPTPALDKRSLRMASVSPTSGEYYGIDQFMRSPQLAGRGRHGGSNPGHTAPNGDSSPGESGPKPDGPHGSDHPQTGTPQNTGQTTPPDSHTPGNDSDDHEPGDQTPPDHESPPASPEDDSEQPGDHDDGGNGGPPVIIPDDHKPPVVSVPEPSSLSLLALGLLGFAARRRRLAAHI